MTVTPLPTPGAVRTAVPVFDIEKVLASIDTMAAQRPVAAQIVSVANSDDTSAKALSRILAAELLCAAQRASGRWTTRARRQATQPIAPCSISSRHRRCRLTS